MSCVSVGDRYSIGLDAVPSRLIYGLISLSINRPNSIGKMSFIFLGILAGAVFSSDAFAARDLPKTYQ